ncbi:hypothetical protein B5M47_03335 [candidate division CPR3 bacterium 4484_211]|uniref:SCP domain-containing protein n=1 Tax=candidate division CPR3 bacterium 4484_211 TaxID=1968527 RepID=A0A1W9NXJ0_UNCC3|nr:MAG: hypothetical protein B5M47_03335 [candidate division CPR3 bacterium 4484_211]
MKRICSLFLPRPQNKRRPHILRHYSLFPLFSAFILLQVNLALFQSSNPNILSFATSIYQQDFFKLINQERQKANVPILVESPKLNYAAQLKAQNMFKNDYWAHVGPDGTTPWDFLKEVDYNYTYAGENLAKDFNTSAGVVAGWMASPSHRSNVLNSKFKEMGIAVVNGVLLGEETTLVVQLFGTPAVLAEQVQKPKAQQPTIQPQMQTIGRTSVTPQPTSQPVQIYPQSIAAEQETSPAPPQGIPARVLSGITKFKISCRHGGDYAPFNSCQQFGSNIIVRKPHRQERGFRFRVLAL